MRTLRAPSCSFPWFSTKRKAIASNAPLGRIGDDDDLKGAVLLFASQAGKHITGQWMAVDGGVSAIIGG